MSKSNQQSPPADSQVISAIENRQEQFKQLYSEQLRIDNDIEEGWYWSHVFTVLDHAKRIFETPMNELNSEKFKKFHKYTL